MKKALLLYLPFIFFILNIRIANSQEILISSPNDMLNLYKAEQIGTKINDFSFLDKNGEAVNSLEIDSPILLFFWDLNICDDCNQQIEEVDNLYVSCLSKNVKLLTFIPNDVTSLSNFEQNVKKVDFPVIANTSDFSTPKGGLLGYPRMYLLNKEHIIIDIIAEPTIELCSKAAIAKIDTM